MKKDEYFALQRATAAQADPLLKDAVADLPTYARRLPEKRIGEPRIRDLAVRLGHEISGGKHWEELAPISASYELLNSATYTTNWMLDDKNDLTSSTQAKNAVIAGHQLRERADDILCNTGYEPITHTISTINAAVHHGQDLDLNALRIDNIGDYDSLDDYLQVYERRCEQLCGEFCGHALSASPHIPETASDNLYDIGVVWGRLFQASNDLGDFAIPEVDNETLEKPYKDLFSDLQNGRLTLPVYELLQTTSGDAQTTIESLIGSQEVTVREAKNVQRILHDTGVFDTCYYDYLRPRHKQLKDKLYDAFDRSKERDAIATMFSVITSNKFIHDLQDVPARAREAQ